MISLEKYQILTRLQKLPKNVGDLGKLIVAKGFKKLTKVQKIAQSGHTDCGIAIVVGIAAAYCDVNQGALQYMKVISAQFSNKFGYCP